jgi:hypothetical protein
LPNFFIEFPAIFLDLNGNFENFPRIETVSHLQISLRAGSIPNYFSFSKSSLGAPQTGQTQSAGKSSNLVPAGIPLSGSPTPGS